MTVTLPTPLPITLEQLNAITLEQLNSCPENFQLRDFIFILLGHYWS